MPPNYDSLVGKLVAWGSTRDEAIARMGRALSETVIAGIHTTIPFYQYVLRHPTYRAGTLDTGLIGELVDEMLRDDVTEQQATLAAGAS